MLENGTHHTRRPKNQQHLDPVIQCVRERAAQLQGFVPMDSIEDLQLTAYTQGRQYQLHYDWFMEHVVPVIGKQNRGSTVFVTLDADCENCGTQFPRVGMDWRNKDPRWCEFEEDRDEYLDQGDLGVGCGPASREVVIVEVDLAASRFLISGKVFHLF
jgi:hypothetical protein